MKERDIKNNNNRKGGVVAAKVLIEPWITEASTAMGEMNKYVFKVFPDVTKEQVKNSIESIYKVKVVSVNTVSIPRKKRQQGRKMGWKAAVKKAVITLKDGDSIDLFGNK